MAALAFSPRYLYHLQMDVVVLIKIMQICIFYFIKYDAANIFNKICTQQRGSKLPSHI